MKQSQVACTIAAIVLVAAIACGGSDAPTGSSGAVQITNVSVTPQAVDCSTLTGKSSPDSITFQFEMVNTTSHEETVATIGSFGSIVSSGRAEDIGRTVGTFNSLPFTPKPATIEAKRGDVTIRVALPAGGLCTTKPTLYVGTDDMNISIRVTTDLAQYVTTPVAVRVGWRPP